jgi:CO/xanthine dehydrogenase FAD-binding subunit
MVAAVLKADDTGTISDARIAVGSCSARAQRLTQLERELIGKTVHRGFGEIVCSDHLQGLSPIDDVRATADYRRDAARTVVARALNTCAGSL